MSNTETPTAPAGGTPPATAAAPTSDTAPQATPSTPTPAPTQEGSPGTPSAGETPAAPSIPAPETPAPGEQPQGGAPPANAPAETPSFDALAVPDGLTSEHVDGLKEFATELGLSPEHAQRVLDRDVTVRQALATEAQAQFDSERAQWADDIAKDPVVGGENAKQAQAWINEAMKACDADGRLATLLHDTQYDGHPDVVRFFANLGKRLTATPSVDPGARVDAPKTTAELLYPNDVPGAS